MKSRFVRAAFLFGLLLTSVASHADELKIVFSQYTPPYVFEDGSGIVVDLVRGALASSGYKIEPVYVPIGRGLKMFADRQVDGTTIIRDSADLEVLYSEDFMQYHNKAFALQASGLKIRRLQDLARRRVIAFQYAHQYLGEEFERLAAANPQYKEVAQQKGQVEMLLRGRADVVVMDEGIFRFYLAEIVAESKIKAPPYVAFDLFPPTPYKAAFHDAKVRDAFNRGVAAMRQDGRYDAVYRHYSEHYFPVSQ